jgi:hypothetical protein
MTDPWAAAQVATAPVQPAATQQAPAQSGNLAGSFAPKGSSLFSNGGNGNFYPALFNKTHAPGTEFSGVILTPPRDVQSMSFPRKEGDPRLPQYWVNDPATGKRVPGTAPRDPISNEPNEPVMDLLIELQTETRFDAATLAAIGRDTSYVDDGKRAFQISGKKRPAGHVAGQATNPMRAVLDAIEAFNAAGTAKITDEESMVGLRLTVRRVDRIQPGVSTSPWLYVARITKAE